MSFELSKESVILNNALTFTSWQSCSSGHPEGTLQLSAWIPTQSFSLIQESQSSEGGRKGEREGGREGRGREGGREEGGREGGKREGRGREGKDQRREGLSEEDRKIGGRGKERGREGGREEGGKERIREERD